MHGEMGDGKCHLSYMCTGVVATLGILPAMYGAITWLYSGPAILLELEALLPWALEALVGGCWNYSATGHT
jgi:hypothetical protein